jgi:HlyD family secretion protein
MHRRPPIPVIILVIVALAVGGYYALREMQAGSDGTLSASGSIEATTVNVSPELSGKVLEVLADEGQPVKAGEPLLKLDPALLTAQRAVSAAALDSVQAALSTAQTNYDLAVQKALAQQQATQSNDWRFSAPDEFNQPAWYFNQGEQLRAAQAELESAQAGFEEANQNLSAVTSALNNADFVKAETRLANARAAFLVADTVKTNADFAAEGGGLQKAADASYNAALEELRTAQKEYNAMLSSQAARDVQDARGTLEVAQQRLDQATARQAALQTGIHSSAVVTAEKLLDQAKTAVAQAEASLALIDTQLGKLTVASSTDGVVLTRNVEPGEFVQPGATAFSLGQLSDMTITVYVPEDRYGEISIGQTAQVRVDSWPGQVFSATVVKIADQAEFTPRNVQTVEGRSSTVYAVKLSVSDPAGKLKIGMPADVVFSQ